MLQIPFISQEVRRKKEKQSKPAIKIPLEPGRDSRDVDRTRLIACKALMVMGRHLEALGHVENFLKDHPDSVEGMLTAGLIASRMRQVSMAIEWFNRASKHVTGRAKTFLDPILEKKIRDLVDIEELVAEAEAHPEDRELALATACALGRSGHFRAVERFLPILEL